jgi:hypothetical protein
MKFMCNAYNIEENSVYPKKGYIAVPGRKPNVKEDFVEQLNGRTKSCGYVARPYHNIPETVNRRKLLNGRLRNFGFMAIPSIERK